MSTKANVEAQQAFANTNACGLTTVVRPQLFVGLGFRFLFVRTFGRAFSGPISRLEFYPNICFVALGWDSPEAKTLPVSTFGRNVYDVGCFWQLFLTFYDLYGCVSRCKLFWLVCVDHLPTTANNCTIPISHRHQLT